MRSRNEFSHFNQNTIDNSDYAPAFNVYFSEKILISDKPPRLGGKIVEVDVQDFSKQMNFNWCDQVLVPRKVRDALWKFKDKQNPPCIERQLNNKMPNIVIADIDEKIGKGVFLAMNADIIKAGTILGIFPGKIDSNKEKAEGIFGVSIAAIEWVGKSSINNAIIDASSSGNYTRFINDLPLEFELDRKNMSKEENEKIATANLLQFVQNHEGIPVVYMVASRDILPGEQLGYSYDAFHWKHNLSKGIKRCVFDLDGKLLGVFKDGSGDKPEIIKNAEYRPENNHISNRTDQYVLACVSNNHLQIPSDFNDYNYLFLQSAKFVVHEIMKDKRYEKYSESLDITLKYISNSSVGFKDAYSHLKNYVAKINYNDDLYLLKSQIIYLAKQREATYNIIVEQNKVASKNSI